MELSYGQVNDVYPFSSIEESSSVYGPNLVVTGFLSFPYSLPMFISALTARFPLVSASIPEIPFSFLRLVGERALHFRKFALVRFEIFCPSTRLRTAMSIDFQRRFLLPLSFAY